MSHLHSIYDTDLHFIIDPITRRISSESGKVTLMQKDHNSERFTFEIPRYIEGHDMSLTDAVQIHYNNLEAASPKRQNKDVYPAVDLQVSPDSEDMVIFSWLISGNATQYVGSLNFIVRFVCHDDNAEITYQWWTDTYTQIKIAATMDNTDSVIDLDDTDLIEAWRQDCIQTVESSGIYEKAEALAKSYAIGGTGTRAGEDTDNAKYYMEKARDLVGTDMVEVVEALSGDEIYPTVSGEFLHREDVSNGTLYGMRLLGKVESDTEGTIDVPSTLHIPGDNGSIGVTIAKKNLWTYSTTNALNNVTHSDGVYTVNGACSASVHTLPTPIPAGTTCSVIVEFTAGNITSTAGGVTIGGYNVNSDGNSWQCAMNIPKYDNQDLAGIKLINTAVVDKPVTNFHIFFYGPSITIHDPVTFKVMFEIADTPTGYQAYSVQTMVITPPSELAGVKIASSADFRDANYTDSYGTPWMSDELDFGEGTYTNRITKLVFDGTEAWYMNNTASAKTNRFMLGGAIEKTLVGGPVYGMASNIAVYAGNSASSNFDTENTCMAYGFNNQKGWLGFAVNPTAYPDVDTFKARLAELYAAGTPVVAYIAERIEPTVTSLSEDQITAFKALKSYYSVLNAFNDSGAEMSLVYQADSTLYKEQSGIPTGDEMYLGKNETAKRATEDALGNNIPHTYQRKDESPTAHTHTTSEITDFPSSMTPTAHTHTKSEITDFPSSMTPTAHTHTKSDITDFDHTHTVADITDFPSSMAPTAHTHGVADITGVLPVEKGGTGGTTAAAARSGLGLGGAATYNATQAVTSGSTALVTSGAVHTELEKKAASSHTQAASTITAGTLAGQVNANATAQATLTTAQVRDAYMGTDELTAGTSTLAAGTFYVQYE